MKISAASAVAPTFSHARSLELIAESAVDPVAGPIGMDEVQLCPQHSGTLTEGVVEKLMELYPRTKFRLHASPKVKGDHSRHANVYASNANDNQEQVAATAALSRRLNAPGYSIHAGVRGESSLTQAFDNVRRMADQFGCRVGIEGLYPPSARENHWLLSTWDEYEQMLNSGIDYALDLSHLNIVAKRERLLDLALSTALIESPQCMEIHISDNNGRADSHRPMTVGAEPWWWDLLVSCQVDAPVFYEGAIHLPTKKRLAA